MALASPPQGRPHLNLASAHERDELLRWVGELYYLHDQSQAAIAAILGVSVSKVSRLLAEARQQGIVSIHVSASLAGESDLERTLAARFGLQAVYVAPARVAGSAVASRVAALAGARLFSRLAPSEGVVGFSGGYTLAQLVDALQPTDAQPLTVVPLQGTWADGEVEVQSDQVGRDAAARLGGHALSLPAPIVVERASTRDALLDDRAIRAVTEWWSAVSVAVVGIGGSPSDDPGYQSVMSALLATVRDDLLRQGVVGDLCAHLFDAHGRFVEHEVIRRTLAIPIEQLRQVPCVVAVAGGVKKSPSLLGALRTGTIHVLVTDQLAAERLATLADTGGQP